MNFFLEIYKRDQDVLLPDMAPSQEENCHHPEIMSDNRWHTSHLPLDAQRLEHPQEKVPEDEACSGPCMCALAIETSPGWQK